MSTRSAASAIVAQAASSADMPSPGRTFNNGCCIEVGTSGAPAAVSPGAPARPSLSAAVDGEAGTVAPAQDESPRVVIPFSLQVGPHALRLHPYKARRATLDHMRESATRFRQVCAASLTAPQVGGLPVAGIFPEYSSTLSSFGHAQVGVLPLQRKD